MVEQQLDRDDSTQGTFLQRVFIAHAGFDKPNVVITEGYGGNYAKSENYVNELSKLTLGNQIFIEHRYFGKSIPDPLNWKHLNVENAATDHHNIITMLKTIYQNKWISTGISKGGQACILHRSMFPCDVDISVPYVAPINDALEDSRHIKFLKKVGSSDSRKKIKEFQLTVLKRRDEIFPLFTNRIKQFHYNYRLPLEEIYDYIVLEYAFAFWQWGTPIENVPDKDAAPNVLMNHLLRISPIDYFSIEGIESIQAFFVQASNQIGYYDYDIKPFKKYLKIKSTHNYLTKLFLPERVRYSYDYEAMKKVKKFINQKDEKMLFIYGEYDPWTASAVEFKGKQNMYKFVKPKGSHKARINNFDDKTRTHIENILQNWISQ